MKKAKKHKKAKNRSKANANDLMLYEHPFASADPEQLKAALLSLAQQKSEDFQGSILELQGLLKKSFPLHILGTMSYALLVGVGAKGVSSKSMLSSIQQHHVELLQSLSLTVELDDWGKDPLVPTEMQKVIDTLDLMASAFHLRRMKDMDGASPKERALLGLIERIRGHTQIVRNWGYKSDVIAISKKLYAAFDASLLEYHGFTATNVLDVGVALTDGMERRLNARFAALRKIFSARTIPELVRRYYQTYPGVNGDPEEFIKIIPAGTSFDAVKSRILAHADLTLYEHLRADITQISTETGCEPEVINKILEKLSLPLGALVANNIEHFFMTNPVWEKPGLSFAGDFYFIVPQAIFSHVHLIMRSLIREAGILPALEKRRSKFLESEVIETFKTVIKDGVYHCNFTGKYKGKDFETDLIIKIDRTLVIAEAKSAALSAEALRGAKDRIKRHIDDLVIDPSEQSARIQAIVRDAQAGDEEAEQILGAIGIDAKSIDHIIRVSVTLDDFSVVCSAEQELKAAGLVDQSIDLPTTLSIADFHVICRILDNPEHLLHYFLERARIQKAIGVLGDELDYLGLYCRTGFNLGKLEESDSNLIITGMSDDIDRYQNSLDAGVFLKKPQPQIHPYFRAVLKEIKRRSVTGWLTMAMDILRCGSFEEQVKYIAAVNTLRESVPKQFRDPKHRCCIIIKPPEPRDFLILVHVFPQKLFEQRKDVSGQIAYEQLKETGRNRCLIIGRMVEEWERPYHYIGVAIDSLEAGSR